MQEPAKWLESLPEDAVKAIEKRYQSPGLIDRFKNELIKEEIRSVT